MADSQEYGVVIARQENNYTLELGNENGCHGCLLAGVCHKQGKKVLLKSDLDLKVGQKVGLQVKSSDRILSSFVVFVLPIVLMVVFYFLGGLFLNPESSKTIFSFLGLILGVVIIKIVDKKASIEVEIKQ